MADKHTASPLKSVRVDALVVLKICKHASSTHPQTVTGQLLGMDVDGELQVTNSFPFPTMEAPVQDDKHDKHDSASGAGAAPRAKANTYYQTEMVRCLREMNVDANSVGWYQSASLGNFLNTNFVENQYFYQSSLNERTVALVHDTARSTSGSLSLRAFRLTPQFMAAHKEGKFTVESLQKHNLTYKDILVELPLTIYNSHLLTSLLHQLDNPAPASLSALSLSAPMPLAPNFDSLDLSIDLFLEKNCDLLLESIETHYSEVNNQQYYHRQLAREQAKITAWQQKRKSENQLRASAKQPLLSEDEWQRLFKLPQEPSRLETLLNSRQIEQYSKQIDGFTASVSAKMFAVNQGLPRTEI